MAQRQRERRHLIKKNKTSCKQTKHFLHLFFDQMMTSLIQSFPRQELHTPQYRGPKLVADLIPAHFSGSQKDAPVSDVASGPELLLKLVRPLTFSAPAGVNQSTQRNLDIHVPVYVVNITIWFLIIASYLCRRL